MTKRAGKDPSVRSIAEHRTATEAAIAAPYAGVSRVTSNFLAPTRQYLIHNRAGELIASVQVRADYVTTELPEALRVLYDRLSMGAEPPTPADGAPRVLRFRGPKKPA